LASADGLQMDRPLTGCVLRRFEAIGEIAILAPLQG
jgi:hypothetical protein